MQTFVSRKTAEELALQLGTKITIEKVSVTFINRIQISNLYIEDLNGDTLLFAPRINANLRRVNLKKKELTIKKINFYDTYINFVTDSSGVINLKFIIDYMKSSKKIDGSKEKWTYKMMDADFNNSRFHYSRDIIKEVTRGVDFTDMELRNLHISLGNLLVYDDTLSMNIKNLSLKEKSGFILRSFSSNLRLAKDHMHFEKVAFKTPWSVIISPFIHLDFNDYKDFSNIIDLVNIKINLDHSALSFNDISFFAPGLKDYSEEFTLSGLFSGRVSDMKGDNIILHYNVNTLLEANFNLIGLPDFKSTFAYFDIKKFITTTEDLELFEIPGNKKKIELPQNFKSLGKIHYSGKYTGYPDDFVAYGLFKTNLGEFATDLLLKPDTSNTLRFTGKLRTRDFFIGRLLELEEKVDKISMVGNINGYTSKGRFYANIESMVDSFRLFGYNYTNIDVSGTLSESSFNGSFAVSDPNISLSFSGKADFSSENPEYAFTADVERARPYYLNVGTEDPSFFMSFLLKTNFTGRNIDDFNGEISLINSLFSKADKQLQIYDFHLEESNTGTDSSSFVIRSDILDGEVTGIYQFSTLRHSLNKLVKHYIPSFSHAETTVDLSDDINNFRYDIRLKNIHPVIAFFFPDFDIGNNSTFSGLYNSNDNKLELNADLPLISFNGNSLTEVSVKTSSSGGNYKIEATSSALVMKNKLKVDNLLLNGLVNSDTAKMHFYWDNQERPRYNGMINLMTVFDENINSGKTRMSIHSIPSSFYFNDTLWSISESIIVLDSNTVMIDTFGISNQNQEFFVYGTISDNPEDGVFMRFRDMDLSLMNVFTSKTKLNLAGIISGEAILRDPRNKPRFISELKIADFKINNEDLGVANLNALWNNQEKKVTLFAETFKGENKNILVKGDYFPETSALDLKISLDKLRITMFEPFLADLISDLNGLGSGELTLKGTLKNPDLNGEVSLQKTSLLVDYLMTRYYFTNDVRVLHNNIIIRDFEIFDEKGSKAVGQGTISTNNLKSISLDFRLSATNFTFLNTTEKDNELFYGRVNAGGIIRFTGPADDMMMDINARTERNSVFYIPLYGAEEIYEHDFIQWVSIKKGEEDDEELNGSGYEVKLKGLKMNFNLEVTTDAEVQLIFDPKIGDILKGRGSGNLKLIINTLGRFEIYGEMIIDRGDYLFTLKNLINKRFEVERGGTISWNGDPLDANIDMKAVYRLKASVYALAPEESLKKRIPVECQIRMTGKLMNPLLIPDIQLPTSDQQTRNIVRNRISTDEEMMKQFLSLLVINNFYSELNTPGLAGAAGRGSGVATSELFTNQLSRWLSQISNDFDIGLNYRQGDEVTTDQLEVALSTQLMNDRVRINTNLGVGGAQTANTPVSNPNNIVGDFDIDFQITESGKLHIKAFNRTNDNLLFRTSPYTQGVGITYREDFNTFKELLIRYKDAIIAVFSKEKRDEMKAVKNEEEDMEENEDEL